MKYIERIDGVKRTEVRVSLAFSKREIEGLRKILKKNKQKATDKDVKKLISLIVTSSGAEGVVKFWAEENSI